ALDRLVAPVGLEQLLLGHADEPAVDIHEPGHGYTPFGRWLGCQRRPGRSARHRSGDLSRGKWLAGHRTLQSPVLVGRDDFPALPGRRPPRAAGGRGHLLLVAGEAGIGKTRLLAAIAAEAAGRSFATVRGGAFPGDTETSGGLLLDLASDLRQSREAGLAEVGEAMAGRLRELAGVGGDRDRQRGRRSPALPG